ncbi:MAG: hypothetical protein GWO24_10115, partial [Akkermansiaceae bacterium]|nr:hypothetical protein [Akkermansiaceae bacterium]
MRGRLRDAEEELAEVTAQNRRARTQGQPSNIQQILRLRNVIAQLRARLNGVGDDGRAKTLAMGVQDHPRPAEPVVLIRGELDKPAQRVSRGFPQVLHHAGTPGSLPDGGSGRL